MNEEGGIFRESFHQFWAKITGFPGAKKSIKVIFFASHHAPSAFSMRPGTLG